MAEWFAVTGDTRRQFTTLADASGAPLDLTGLTPVLRIGEAVLGRRAHPAKGTASIIQSGLDPNFTDKGVVAYDPAAADVAAAGDLLCQWQLTSGSNIRTVPDFEPFVWRISPRIT